MLASREIVIGVTKFVVGAAMLIAGIGVRWDNKLEIKQKPVVFNRVASCRTYRYIELFWRLVSMLMWLWLLVYLPLTAKMCICVFCSMCGMMVSNYTSASLTGSSVAANKTSHAHVIVLPLWLMVALESSICHQCDNLRYLILVDSVTYFIIAAYGLRLIYQIEREIKASALCV